MQTMNCHFFTEAHLDHEQFECSMPFNLWHTTSFCLPTILTYKSKISNLMNIREVAMQQWLD